jgi:hypothetical protein
MVDGKENKAKRGCIPGELDAGADDGAGSLVSAAGARAAAGRQGRGLVVTAAVRRHGREQNSL